MRNLVTELAMGNPGFEFGKHPDCDLSSWQGTEPKSVRYEESQMGSSVMPECRSGLPKNRLAEDGRITACCFPFPERWPSPGVAWVDSCKVAALTERVAFLHTCRGLTFSTPALVEVVCNRGCERFWLRPTGHELSKRSSA